MFQSPFSVLFTVGNFEIKMYGVMLFIAIVCGLLVANFISKKYFKDLDIDKLFDFFPILIFVSIVCARIYYVLLNIDYYWRYKSEIIAIWHGGISIHGAILGGIFAVIFYCKKNKINFFNYADIIVPSLALGQAIGRWGNFFNSEAFGLPCNLPWKLYIAPAFRPVEFYEFDFFHPAFLYESLWDLGLFLFLLLLFKFNLYKKSGGIFFFYLALYSFGRFFIENLRIDSVLNLASVPIAQIVSAFVFNVSIFGIILRYKKRPI